MNLLRTLRAARLALCATALAAASAAAQAPTPDPRVGLKPGLMDAGQASWNMRLLSNSPPSPPFVGKTSSDLAFTGRYAIQGNYNGWQIWDISNPAHPALATAYVCPASQSDVSVYRNLLFVSGEGLTGRLDCGTQGVQDTVSAERLRGLRIFDISDVAHPRNVGNVQTCRGSHTHTLLVDPRDTANVYVYISGSASVRSGRELPGCVRLNPSADPNSSLFRIEVVRVPLAHPEQAAIVSSPRIFQNLVAPPKHADTPEELESARAHGRFTGIMNGRERVVSNAYIRPMLDSIVQARGGTGPATAADSAALRQALPGLLAVMFPDPSTPGVAPQPGPTQCHDITVYPAMGLAGGACEGYGLLLDIRDPAHPVRLTAVADSNFSYWHSATFNNDGTRILLSDEWGGGGQAKCRAGDPREWGADAIFAIEGRSLRFQGYYKLPSVQTAQENCVAHNGALIPVPGRDVMVQSWYQGGLSVFDWTDGAHPREIAFFDRGPVDSTRITSGGTWSAYWYNGVIVSSEEVRGLDVLELTPSQYLSQNEIDAAKTVHLDYLNTQGQPHYTWPPSFALVRAYADQLERSGALSAARLAALRATLTGSEQAPGSTRRVRLGSLATRVAGYAAGSPDAARVRKLAAAIRALADARV